LVNRIIRCQCRRHATYHPGVTGERNPARVFGEVADDYDRVRPPYPATVVDDVMAYGRSGPGGRRALEVGAGTGRATEPFAAAGLAIVALEPDDAMIRVLTRRVARFPRVEVVRASFEQFRPAERFGLLFSAEAWHWTAPGTRWTRAADALAGGGTLALFFHRERIADPALRAAVLRVFAEHAPSIVIRDEPVTAGVVWHRWPGDELAARDEFDHRASRHHLDRRTMPKAGYLDLTRTRSQFRMLPAPVRRNLWAALSRLFPDEVPLDVHTTLVLARRVTAAGTAG
jgi:SAM-dependent methyltransferase